MIFANGSPRAQTKSWDNMKAEDKKQLFKRYYKMCFNENVRVCKVVPVVAVVAVVPVV